MPRKCTICAHKKRSAIDKALVERRAFRTIADQFRVSKTALLRHHDDHLPSSLVKAQEATEAAQADALLAQVVDLRDKALGVLEQAEASEDLRAALNAIREARGCVELLGKLAGQLKDSPTINVILMPEWRELQTAILKALAPHRDARLAVTTALAEMESHHAAGHA
jgi:hypothetical protein